MNRLLNMVMRQLMRAGTKSLEAGGQPMTPEQKAAQKRVAKAIKATRRINRI